MASAEDTRTGSDPGLGLPSLRGAILFAIAALSVFSLLTALGLSLTQYLPSYFADEWTWLNFAFSGGIIRSSICRFFGHPTVIPNLHLLLNYEFLGGSSLARALTVGVVTAAGAIGIGRIALRGVALDAVERRVYLLVFASLGFWPALSHKFVWSFGLTDSLVTLGAVIAAGGLLRVETGNHASTHTKWIYPFLLLVAGSMLGTFSFGSGLALWPAFFVALVMLRAPIGLLSAYAVAGILAVWTALAGLPDCMPTGSSLAATMAGIKPANVIATALLTIAAFPAHALVQIAAASGSNYSVIGIALVSLLCAGLLAVGVSNWRRVRSEGGADRAMVSILTIALSVLGATVLVGIARSSAGINVAYSSRYAAMSLPFWISIFALLLRKLLLARESSGRRLGSLFPLVAALAVSMIVAYSNNVWSRMYLMFRRGSDIGAMHLLIDPTSESVGLKRYYLHAGRIVAALPRLSADGKDFMALPAVRSIAPRLGRQRLVPEEIRGGCFGTVVATTGSSTERSMVFSGWAIDAGGARAQWIEVYRDETLVGFGLNSGLAENWHQDIEKHISAPEKVLMAVARPIARAFGLYPGWVALVRPATANGKTEKGTDLRFFLRTSDDKLCEIKSNA